MVCLARIQRVKVGKRLVESSVFRAGVQGAVVLKRSEVGKRLVYPRVLLRNVELAGLQWLLLWLRRLLLRLIGRRLRRLLGLRAAENKKSRENE